MDRPAGYVITGPTRAETLFYGWKVDSSSPFARTPAGIDIIDEVLDIVVSPERTHNLRDVDELSRLVDMGIYSEADAQQLHAVALEVIALAQAGAPPFDDEWIAWQPDSGLVLGESPQGWQYLSVPTPYRPYAGSGTGS